jgi:hypothetical protein
MNMQRWWNALGRAKPKCLGEEKKAYPAAALSIKKTDNVRIT